MPEEEGVLAAHLALWATSVFSRAECPFSHQAVHPPPKRCRGRAREAAHRDVDLTSIFRERHHRGNAVMLRIWNSDRRHVKSFAPRHSDRPLRRRSRARTRSKDQPCTEPAFA